MRALQATATATANAHRDAMLSSTPFGTTITTTGGSDLLKPSALEKPTKKVSSWLLTTVKHPTPLPLRLPRIESCSLPSLEFYLLMEIVAREEEEEEEDEM